MTANEAIALARGLRDTEISDAVLLKWLSDHDGQFWLNVLQDYCIGPSEMPVYEAAELALVDGADVSPALLVPAPWDGLYGDWLTMMIDLHHGDYERYNNDAALYAAKRQEFVNWLNRTYVWREPEINAEIVEQHGVKPRPNKAIRF